MAKKKKNTKKPDVSRQTDYYRLNTKAVRDLAEANEENSPEVSEEELRKYRSGGSIKVSDWVKMCFIKWWFPGSVCFFFIWGLGTYLGDQLDLLLATGIALGVVQEMLTNNVIRFVSKTPGGNDHWLMFPSKRYYTFPANILYAILLLALVYGTYNVINMVLVAVSGATDTVPLGVEPILFGVFYMGYDQLLIQVKHMIFGKKRIRKAKKSK